MDYFIMLSFLSWWHSSSVNHCSYITQQYEILVHKFGAKTLQVLSQVKFTVTILPCKWNSLLFGRLMFIAEYRTTMKPIWWIKLALTKMYICIWATLWILSCSWWYYLGSFESRSLLWYSHIHDITYLVLCLSPYCAYCQCSWRYYLYSFVKEYGLHKLLQFNANH
jgi:hypothetical protein